MNLSRRRRGDVELVTLESSGGNLSPDHSEQLRVELGSLAEDAGRLVLDLGRIELMTSSGIGALINARRRVRRRGGRLVLTGVSPALLAVLQKLRVVGLFEVADDVEDALERLSSP